MAISQDLIRTSEVFCELIDDLRNSGHGSSALAELARVLPRLHAELAGLNHRAEAGEHLPCVDLEARFDLYSQLKVVLGEYDSYWLEYDHEGHSQSPSGSLADDLTDIYCELQLGLSLLECSPNQTLDIWEAGYRLNWGQHLVDAAKHLYTLHSRDSFSH